MLSFSSIYCSATPVAKSVCKASFIRLIPRNSTCFRVSRSLCCSSDPTENLLSDQCKDSQVRRRSNYAGVRLDETVTIGSGKLRLDSWISSRIPGVSRARVQSSIRSGLVSVNGLVVDKQVSHVVRDRDKVNCMIAELQPLRAIPEDIPLDIVFEDAHVIVVNKPAHMVVHPAPGNPNGTLVNGILYHCSLPIVPFPRSEIISEMEDTSEDSDMSSNICGASVRPGIVHRLDRGTSGLLVIAKDEHSHTHLCEQFKLHSIQRVYISLTSGVPSPSSGRIDIPVGRDLNNRIRMAAASGTNNRRHARNAASRYKVIEILACGGSALVEWRLETGRTHQIRAHAKYLGIPLLGDELYGGTKSMAMSLLRPRIVSSYHGCLSKLLSKLQRPCLHALVLGFMHPHTGEYVQFSCPPPPDFAEILSQLRSFSTTEAAEKQK